MTVIQKINYVSIFEENIKDIQSSISKLCAKKRLIATEKVNEFDFDKALTVENEYWTDKLQTKNRIMNSKDKDEIVALIEEFQNKWDPTIIITKF